MTTTEETKIIQTILNGPYELNRDLCQSYLKARQILGFMKRMKNY